MQPRYPVKGSLQVGPVKIEFDQSAVVRQLSELTIEQLERQAVELHEMLEQVEREIQERRGH